MLEGKTRIELTNPQNNETEVFEEVNMITNAVPDIFKYNPSGLLYPTTGTNTYFDEEIFPVANKCFGGVLLFHEPLEENPQKYYAPSTNEVIGYASDNVNSTDNSKRGSLNLTESKELKNGFKFVWDFTTSQGNGLISSIALTHYRGGRVFYGDEFNKDNAFICIKKMTMVLDVPPTNYYGHVVEANIIDNELISIVPNTNHSIDIVYFKEPLLNIGLLDNVASYTPQDIQKHSIQTQGFFFEGLSVHKASFFDGKDGYWYGFIYKVDTKVNVTYINRIKINKNDFSFEINNWELKEDQLQDIAYTSATNSGYLAKTISACLVGNYLYTINRNYSTVYKLNINNPVDVVRINLGFRSNFGGGSDIHLRFIPWGDYILANDFILTQDDKVIRTASGNIQFLTNHPIEIGPYRLGYSVQNLTSKTVCYKTLLLHTPYLATINNLSKPITKTADKMMKITYTLTEKEV